MRRIQELSSTRKILCMILAEVISELNSVEFDASSDSASEIETVCIVGNFDGECYACCILESFYSTSKYFCVN